MQAFTLILLTFCLTLPKAHAQNLCDIQKLSRYFSDVQKLQRPQSSPLEIAASCSSTTYKEQIAFWNDFYKENADGQIPEYTIQFTRPSGQDQKALELYEARIGKTQSLRVKFEGGEPGYISDPSIRLTLARSLARSSLYAEAISYYEDYLKTNADDDSADAEYLYTIIWSGNLDSARSRLEHLKGYELTPYLKQVTERASSLLDRLENDGKTPDEEQTLLAGVFKVENEFLQQTDESKRNSYLFSYQDELQLSLGIHKLDATLDDRENTASHFIVGYQFSITDIWSFETDIGYYSFGNDPTLGKIKSSLAFKSFSLHLMAKRRPLVFYEVVPEVGQDVIRNHFESKLIFFDFVDFLAEIQKDGSLSPSERYELNFRLPAFRRNQGKERLDIEFPLGFQARPKPSPYFRSYPRDIATGVKALYQLSVVESYTVKFGAHYILHQRNSYLNRDSYQRLIQYGGFAYLSYDLSAALKLEGTLRFDESERSQFERSDDRELLAKLGLSFTADP